MGRFDGERDQASHEGRLAFDAWAQEASTLNDKRLLPGLIKVAGYHRVDRDYDCRPKWMAVAALARQESDEAIACRKRDLLRQLAEDVRAFFRKVRTLP